MAVAECHEDERAAPRAHERLARNRKRLMRARLHAHAHELARAQAPLGIGKHDARAHNPRTALHPRVKKRDFARKRAPGKIGHLNPHMIARFHPGCVTLVEVREDPKLGVIHNRKQRLLGCDALALARADLCHDAACGRADHKPIGRKRAALNRRDLARRKPQAQKPLARAFQRRLRDRTRLLGSARRKRIPGAPCHAQLIGAGCKLRRIDLGQPFALSHARARFIHKQALHPARYARA